MQELVEERCSTIKGCWWRDSLEKREKPHFLVSWKKTLPPVITLSWSPLTFSLHHHHHYLLLSFTTTVHRVDSPARSPHHHHLLPALYFDCNFCSTSLLWQRKDLDSSRHVSIGGGDDSINDHPLRRRPYIRGTFPSISDVHGKDSTLVPTFFSTSLVVSLCSPCLRRWWGGLLSFCDLTFTTLLHRLWVYVCFSYLPLGPSVTVINLP